MEAATLSRTNGTQSRDRSAVKRRLTWESVVPFPGNPIYVGRLAQMRREWGGYYHGIVGSPAIFDNSACAFPDYPEDAMFIGDGCHRHKLAEEDGKLGEEFLADLYRGLTRAEMYRQRRGLNDRRTVKPAESFLARAEENPHGMEAAIKKLVEGLGWAVSYEMEDGGLACTNELRWIYDRAKGGRSALMRAIQSYEAAFGTKATQASKGQSLVVKGLGAFWVKYPDADMDRLVRSLKGITVKELYESGRTQNLSTTFIKSVFDGVRYSLAMGYNRNQRAGKKLTV